MVLKLTAAFQKLNHSIQQRAKDCEGRMIPFAIFGFVAYVLYYLINIYILPPQSYENILPRIIISILCLFLLLKNYWPNKFKPFLPIYWYITLLYSLPFFITFMTLKNHAAAAWIMNLLSVVILMILLVDWITYSILLILGISLAWLACNLTASEPFVFNPGTVTIKDIISTFIASIIMSIIFSRNKEKIELEKLQTMKTLGTSIAHEIRTPLAAIHMASVGIKEYWPHLVDSYKLAKQHALPVYPLRNSQFDIIAGTVDDILAETRYANSIINMLLLKADELTLSENELKIYSIADCINEALRRYPFAEGERELIEWDDRGDFLFKGNVLFMIHVIFNLVKNALYYIHAARKGKIYIWLEVDKQVNKLFFKDTGSGIPAKYMKHLFERFFSKTHGGTGLGLAFAKMVMQGFGGNITCHSIEGEFAEFELGFPKLQEVEFKPSEINLAF